MGLLQVAAEKIQSSGSRVQDTVVNALVDVEVNRRADLLTQALNKQDELERQIKKMDRPDTKLRTSSDSEVQEYMSDKRFEEVTKLKEKHNNLTKVIDTALESNTEESYKKLNEVYGKLANDKGGSKPEGSAQ